MSETCCGRSNNDQISSLDLDLNFESSLLMTIFKSLKLESIVASYFLEPHLCLAFRLQSGEDRVEQAVRRSAESRAAATMKPARRCPSLLDEYSSVEALVESGDFLQAHTDCTATAFVDGPHR